MNDFTKEDLKNILNGNVEIYPCTYEHIRKKIQSMIDNYCAHEKVVPNYDCKTQCAKWDAIL